MAFDQDPAVATMFPAMGFPGGAGMRGAGPMAMNPNVAVAIPAVMAIDPHPSVVRRTVVTLDNGRRRLYADDNLSHRGHGRQKKSKQR